MKFFYISDFKDKKFIILMTISLQLMADGVSLETGQNALLSAEEELKQEQELVLNLLQKTEELTV